MSTVAEMCTRAYARGWTNALHAVRGWADAQTTMDAAKMSNELEELLAKLQARPHEEPGQVAITEQELSGSAMRMFEAGRQCGLAQAPYWARIQAAQELGHSVPEVALSATNDGSNARAVLVQEGAEYLYAIPCACGQLHTVSSETPIEAGTLAKMRFDVCLYDCEPGLMHLVLPK